MRRVRLGRILGVLLVGTLGYFACWPVPIRPVAWQASSPPGYTGPFAPNTKLTGLQAIDLGGEVGPEHILIGPDGRLYAALGSGGIVRMDTSGAGRETFATTGGRVLGFAFDTAGRMIAADAMRGLLAITPDGTVSLLTDHVAPHDPIGYADAVVVAPDGTIYFTDASTRFLPSRWGGTYEASVLDILEQSGTGRVLAYEPSSGQTRIVAHGFSFANGLALSEDGHSLFVNETGQYRVWKIDGRATELDVRTNSPQAVVLLDNLPGYPDNLMRGREGRIWVGLFKPRNPAADKLARWPSLRKVLLRLPRSWLPLGQSYSHVFAIDERGKVVADLQDPTGGYPEATGVTETADRLYIHSLHAHVLGWLPASVVTGNTAPRKETIYVLRSVREQHPVPDGWCSRRRAGFDPLPSDGERFFSLWSIATDPTEGRIIDAHRARVAELRACMGATDERVRQHFFAEITLAGMTFQGRGECLALQADFPEAGLYPVRCQLLLSGLPAPYLGGVLTTNTISSRAAYGESDPPGYTQASIATIRLWTTPTPTRS